MTKYLATVVVTERWTIEISAKDEDKASEKLEKAFEKINRLSTPPSEMGDFEVEEEITYEFEEE
jgi:hypothetical protein